MSANPPGSGIDLYPCNMGMSILMGYHCYQNFAVNGVIVVCCIYCEKRA